MNPACTVHSHNAGLFSLINKVMVCLSLHERVHVDWSQGTLYSPVDVNLWTELFEQIDPREDGAPIITEYPDSSITFTNVAKLYGTTEWRQKYHECWKRVRVRPEIIARANAFIIRHWRNRHIVSVLVRANSHRGEQITDRSQSLEEYTAAFARVRRPDSLLHVMACDYETIRWFRARYPDAAAYPFTRRTESREKDCHMQEQQTVDDARMCLAEVLILARSHVLIHPCSNMSTASLYINPQLESVYLP